MSRLISRAPGRPDVRLVYDNGRRPRRRSRALLIAVVMFLIVFATVVAFSKGVVR